MKLCLMSDVGPGLFARKERLILNVRFVIRFKTQSRVKDGPVNSIFYIDYSHTFLNLNIPYYLSHTGEPAIEGFSRANVEIK
jgi:hypothetical protein